jgi:hypothetical protein
MVFFLERVLFSFVFPLVKFLFVTGASMRVEHQLSLTKSLLITSLCSNTPLPQHLLSSKSIDLFSLPPLLFFSQFSVYCSYILSDPTHEEEDLHGCGTLTVVCDGLSSSPRVLLTTKRSGAPVSATVILPHCIGKAAQRASEEMKKYTA